MQMYFIMAIVLMILGHFFKMLRWKEFINVYEKADNVDLFKAMAIGQGINMLVPFRLGDAVRIYLSGKKLKNGYALSIATVLADLYIDTLTVGMAFSTLYLLNIHVDEIEAITRNYLILAILLIVLTIVMIVLKKYVKRIIQVVASCFNSKIELGLLLTTYSTIASIKNIVKKLNIFKLIGFTVGIWVSYFSSYAAFAIFMQSIGYNFTLTGVFKTLFSFNGSSMIGLGLQFREQMGWIAYFIIYLLIPLCLILVASLCLKKRVKEENEYHYILPQLNENEKLAFLEVYFSNEERREYVNLYLEINKDVNVIRDYSAGSNATTMLCLNAKGTFFRKYAFGEDALKLKEQVEWLEEYADILPLSNIIGKNIGDKYCCYDMEYNPKAVGFFQYIHSAPTDRCWNVLFSVLELLKERLHTRNVRPAEKEVIDKYIESKVVKNIDICRNGGKYLKALSGYDTVVINGIEYPNLKYYAEMLAKENLEKIFANDQYASIHGDLTIENIICLQNQETDNFYLIDPNTGSLHESPFLDYSKLLQSLHGGYEFLMMVKDVEIIENHVNFLFTKSLAYSALYENFRKYLFDGFSYEEVKSIYYHEIIHYLRLMPYKIRKDSKKAVIFYSGMLMVLNDIKHMFEDETAEKEEDNFEKNI